MLRCPKDCRLSDDPASALARVKRAALAVFRNRLFAKPSVGQKAGRFTRRPKTRVGLAADVPDGSFSAASSCGAVPDPSAGASARPGRGSTRQRSWGSTLRSFSPNRRFAGDCPLQPTCRRPGCPARALSCFSSSGWVVRVRKLPTGQGHTGPASGFSRGPAVPRRHVGAAATALGFFLFQVSRPPAFDRPRAPSPRRSIRS